MAKVSKITVEQEVTKVVEETRYVLELTELEAQEVYSSLLARGDWTNISPILDALYDAGVRFGP